MKFIKNGIYILISLVTILPTISFAMQEEEHQQDTLEELTIKDMIGDICNKATKQLVKNLEQVTTHNTEGVKNHNKKWSSLVISFKPTTPDYNAATNDIKNGIETTLDKYTSHIKSKEEVDLIIQKLQDGFIQIMDDSSIKERYREDTETFIERTIKETINTLLIKASPILLAHKENIVNAIDTLCSNIHTEDGFDENAKSHMDLFDQIKESIKAHKLSNNIVAMGIYEGLKHTLGTNAFSPKNTEDIVADTIQNSIKEALEKNLVAHCKNIFKYVLQAEHDTSWRNDHIAKGLSYLNKGLSSSENISIFNKIINTLGETLCAAAQVRNKTRESLDTAVKNEFAKKVWLFLERKDHLQAVASSIAYQKKDVIALQILLQRQLETEQAIRTTAKNQISWFSFNRNNTLEQESYTSEKSSTKTLPIGSQDPIFNKRHANLLAAGIATAAGFSCLYNGSVQINGSVLARGLAWAALFKVGDSIVTSIAERITNPLQHNPHLEKFASLATTVQERLQNLPWWLGGGKKSQ